MSEYTADILSSFKKMNKKLQWASDLYPRTTDGDRRVIQEEAALTLDALERMLKSPWMKK